LQEAARKRAEKEAKVTLRGRQREETERRRREIEEEARRRYEEATEQMGSWELEVHGKVVQGSCKPFHYFKAQDPST
jgi:hypothetical protein